MGDLIPVEYRAERVLTTEQLAQAYECEPNNIKKNFKVNKDRFDEGKHYYMLEGDALKAFKDEVTNRNLVGKNASHLYLWTRRGASRHSKMLGTDRAWEMFDALEESYFTPRPKEIFADAVTTSKTSILIGGLAKLIKQQGVDIGQTRLFAWLRENGFLIKSGTEKNMPTQRAMEMNLFEVKEGSYVDGNGVNRIMRTTKVTGKGQVYFVNKFLANKKG